jgi:CheY-like chemotaxis protein
MDSLGQLTGGIAHDFNNMLGGILGYGQLLAAKLSDEKLKLYAERIVETSKRATDLTSKLLTFSRKGRKISTPVDIHSCIGDATEILERSIDKKITIEKQLKADNSIIMGDPALFQNIILNLGMNSRDSMPQGGLISITTENILLNKELCSQNSFNLMPGCYIKITVEDNGAGIDEKHLEHVFEPFFTTKQQRKGTGLGLATVYGAVREHNGSITVESELNKGTKFEILLPVSSIQTSPEKKPDERIICGSGLILIIDDEEIIRSMTTELLEDLGYEVVSANNGNEGVRLFSEYRDKIDLVILDMVMPEMNGEECFRKIMKLNPQAKVIICSGYVNGANIDSLKNEGVIDFIKKPFNPGIFSHIIYEALKNKSAFPKEDA